MSETLVVIRSLSAETGLELKWKKCHLYGTPELAERCKILSKPRFPLEIVIHDSYDMIYLKAPIGSDQFVARWLKTKLSKVEAIIKTISLMPFKHEGFTLLRSCASECRVMYLMRVLPPSQLGSFMTEFDQLLKRGFEEMLGISIEEKWWRLAQLPPKYGGMALRSGLRTLGAQHLCSIAKCADNVDRIVGGWDVVATAKRDTEDWLNNACAEKVDIEGWVSKLRKKETNEANGWFAGSNYRYSLPQLCELYEQTSVSKLMSTKERLHIEAHSGQSHAWITLLPLSFKKYNLSSSNWVAASRRRLMLDVFPCQKHCAFCKGGWCDVKGDHATMCGGGPSRILRHNNIRNIIAKAARDVGFKTDLEHGGGLGDKRRPGDVILYNWRDGRHLLIDVAVVNPLCSTRIDSLISEGVGGAAAAYGKKKEAIYHDLDFNQYEFLPFIMETTGGLSKASFGFIKEIKNRYESLNCNVDSECPWNYEINSLQSAINVELQRANSRMVLERTPVLEDLIETSIVKSELAVAKKKEIAIENLRLERLRPRRIYKSVNTGSNCNVVPQTAVEGLSVKVSRLQDRAKGGRKWLKEKKPKMPQEKGACPLNPSNWEPPGDIRHTGASTQKTVALPMEVENEERILALNSKISHNPSTSSSGKLGKFKRTSLNDKKNVEIGIMDKKTGVFRNTSTLVVSSPRDYTERKDIEKVHWEPPGRKTDCQG